MEIYADVLICLNLFVNFLLLQAVRAITKYRVPLWRQILAAGVGAVCSLYIFAPALPAAVELLVRLGISCLVILCFAGRCPLVLFLRSLAVFYGVSFVYAGLMFALWLLFRPAGMSVHNGVVYFAISPIVLVVSTMVCYLLLKGINRFFDASRRERLCEIRLFLDGREARLTALADTGHGLRDTLSDAPVVIVGRETGERLFGCEAVLAAASGRPPEAHALRYRVIPYRSVGGGGLLPAFRCDKMEISARNKIRTIDGPVVALNDQPLGGGYGAILDASLVE
ncbi:MAG: sigma-E processing peptidase SpoIIGA [Candidatus Howiella sp.]|jgi:stage II sporulation protein GA (sporulation sigma-E factor processing peptidase)